MPAPKFLRMTVFGEAAMKHCPGITSLRFSLTWILLTGLAWSAITVSPKRAAVVVSTQTQQFTCSNPDVTWSVDGLAGGNAKVGTISATGVYRPPAVAGVHVVKRLPLQHRSFRTLPLSPLPIWPEFLLITTTRRAPE